MLNTAPPGHWSVSTVLTIDVTAPVPADGRLLRARSRPVLTDAAGGLSRCEVTDPAGYGTEPFLDGCRRGAIWGTSWHGALENDEFRRRFLAEVAALAGRDFTPAPGTSFAAVREERLDVLADLVTAHLDTAALSRLIEEGPVPGLPAPARLVEQLRRMQQDGASTMSVKSSFVLVGVPPQ